MADAFLKLETFVSFVVFLETLIYSNFNHNSLKRWADDLWSLKQKEKKRIVRYNVISHFFQNKMILFSYPASFTRNLDSNFKIQAWQINPPCLEHAGLFMFYWLGTTHQH